MNSPIDKKISPSIINVIKDKYGFSEINYKSLFSYFGGVFEIKDQKNKTYILKIIRKPDEYKIRHLDAEIVFSSTVTQTITEFITQSFIPDREKVILQKVDADFFYLLEKHEIIKKTILTKDDQQLVGKLMRIFHTKLSNFKHDGLGDSLWMREVDEKQYSILLKVLHEDEFAKYVEPLDYEKLSLNRTMIHGDWHGDNMSFTEPPFLYDLDTLCYGSAVEEIAWALTHFDTGVSVKEFYDNLLLGYRDLKQHEIDFIPHVAIAICYKCYAELTQHGDEKYAGSFIKLAKEIKRLFNLPS